VKERLPDMNDLTQNVVRCWCISKEINKHATNIILIGHCLVINN